MRPGSSRPVFGTLAVVSILYGACLALVQTDIKKVIAYSSISHLGYVMLGLVSLDLIGIQGAVMQMVSHGLVAGGLFLMVGMIYERCHTRELAAYGGIAKLLPDVFGVPRGAHAGGDRAADDERIHRRVPGAARRVPGGLAAVCGRAPPIRSCWPASAVAGVVLGALYMLGFAQQFLFGAAKAPHQPFGDLSFREGAILSAIVVAVFALGLFPDGPMKKTELAALQYRQLVSSVRTGGRSRLAARALAGRDARGGLPRQASTKSPERQR